MLRTAYRHDGPPPCQTVRSGSDFHAGAEQAELDVVHHGDAERLTRGGIEFRGDRLVAWTADPRRLVPAHGLATDADDHGTVVLLIDFDRDVLEDSSAVDE